MTDVFMTINGERRTAEATFGVINPATGSVHAEAPACSPAQLDEAFDAAAKAFLDWRADEDARRALLKKAAKALMRAGEQIGPVLTAEQGKPLAAAKMEPAAAGYWLNYFAGLEMPREVIQDDGRGFAQVVRRPMGVVAAITPWNFPIVLSAWKLGPALLAGNTVVLKPSPYTPRSTLLLGEILNEILPPGVLNVVSGGDELGKLMTSHPTPRKISFTGSIAAGKHIAASAAPDLKRLTLELGGNDAAILLDDVDPSAIAEKLFTGAFDNSGQVCSAIKRLYVPESLHDDLVDALAQRVSAARVGDGMAPETEIGPIQNKPQFDRVCGLVSEALSSGASAAAGGGPIEGPGYFFRPTLLVGATEGQRIVDEEQFGPALPVLAYRDIDEAVARANATMYGLSGSVWSPDVERAGAVADRLECGTTWVNAHVELGPHQPFGGVKWSGIGVENGPWGVAGFTEVQVQYRARG
jgi:acyl-CoA reductase-like NAD-dependent aldehyde dehydrogenase